jgi:regulator of protease activity HflC (stomatin/prohibitin superfamily)
MNLFSLESAPLLVFAAVLIAILLFTMIFQVQQNEVRTVTRFGRFVRIASAGLNIKLPAPFEQLDKRINFRVFSIAISQQIRSKDNLFMTLSASVQTSVTNNRDSIIAAAYSVDNVDEMLAGFVMDAMRSVTGNKSSAELYEESMSLGHQLEEQVAARFAAFGYQIQSITVGAPHVSEEVQRSFDKVVSAARGQEAAQFEAHSTLIRRRGEAEADAAYMIRQAQGISEARALIFNGYVALLRENADALHAAGVNPERLMEQLIEFNRLDAIVHASSKGKLVVMDVAAPSRLGAQFAAQEAAGEAKPTRVPTAG